MPTQLGNDGSRWALELVDEVAARAPRNPAAALLLDALLERVGGATAQVSPARLFDALARGEALPEGLQGASIEVLARPGDPMPSRVLPGDVWIRRALGEGRLAHVAIVAAPHVHELETLAPAGLRAEGTATGLYLHVVEVGPRPQEIARRVSHDGRRVAPDSVLLRLHAASSEAELALAEDAQEEDSTFSLSVGVGQRKVVRARAHRLPARSYTWTSTDPSIATATPLGTPSTHPNRVRIEGLRAGQTTVRVRYVAQDGFVADGVVTVTVAAPADRPTEVAALRQAAIDRATRHDTFLTPAEVTTAIDGRASRPELDTLFDAEVDAIVAQHATDASQVPARRERGAARVVGFLEDDLFRCATASNRVVIHREVVDGMKLTWTRTGETQSVAGATCQTAPTRCPAVDQPLHTSGDASHFMSASQDGLRVLELAGLFGADLRTLASQSARARRAVKTIAPSPPLGTLSVVAIRQGTNRELHVARQSPRRVASVIDGAEWRGLPFEATLGTDYDLFKGRWFEASLHRQWGTQDNVAWIVGLCRFYFDRTGMRLGVGDISHVVGEVMTDHGSHRLGRDVDVYPLDPPVTGALPTSYWCEGTRTALVLKTMRVPAETDAQPTYTAPSGSDPALATAAATRVITHFATIAAYCVGTVGRLDAFVWHGARAIRDESLRIAQQAWDDTVAASAGTTASPGWRARWGAGPATRAALVALPNARLVGDGSGSYGAGRGWPPHQDHVHIRLL